MSIEEKIERLKEIFDKYEIEAKDREEIIDSITDSVAEKLKQKSK